MIPIFIVVSYYDSRDGSNTFPDILHTIGNTPLIKLNKIPQSAGIQCDMCKYNNIFQSINCRWMENNVILSTLLQT